MARNVSQITIPVKYLTNTKALGKAQSQFSKFGGAVASIAAASVAAVAGIGTAAARMASEFEDSFAKIQGLVGVSAQELGVLEEAAARLGPEFGKSANEAADALFFITSAGLRGEDAINVLEASLKGAAIGLGETKTIADLATSAVNAYGAATLDGSEAVDVLTEAVREGKLEPAELAGAMGQVLPIASALGVGFDEVGAAMAAMSRTGTDASQASTQLRGILNAVIKPTAEAERTLSGLGLSAEGLREQMGTEGLLPTLETLTGAFDGNIEATAQVFGNVRALTGVMDLMGSNVEGTRQIFDNMTDGVGVLDEAFEITSETVSFKFNKAMETAKSSLLPVGDTLLDIGSKLLDALMPTIDLLAPTLEEMFSHLEEPLMELAAILPDVIEAFMPFLPIIGEIAGIVAELAVALMPVFVALMDALVPIFEMLMPVIQTVVDIFIAFLPVIVQIIEVFTNILEQILPVFIELWEKLEEPILRVVDALVPLLATILPALVVLIEQVFLPILLTLSEMFSEVLVFAIEKLADWLEWLSEQMGINGQSFSDTWYNVSVAVIKQINAMIGGFETLLNRGIGLVNGFLEAYNKVADEVGLEELDLLGNVKFGRLDIPGRFDNMVFEEVDVSGIGGNLGARFGRDTGDRDALASVQDLMSGGTGFGEAANQWTFRGMAQGGIVKAGRGGILANIGEGYYDEAVIPLKPGMDMGDTYNITVNAGIGTDGNRVGEEIVRAIKRYERTSGPVFVSA